MTVSSTRPTSTNRVQRMQVPGRVGLGGKTVREVDTALQLNGAGDGLLDTTHFDTVRFPPPEWAAETMAAIVTDGALAYTAYRGSSSVIEAITPRLERLVDSEIAPDSIVLTPGTQGGLFTVLSALVDEGDLVMLADPEYLFPERMLAFLGADVERIPVHWDGEYGPRLDVERIESLLPRRPRLLLFSNPSNPTGGVYSRDALAEIAAVAERGDFLVVADELYARLSYDTPVTPMRSVDGAADRVITLLGPSKTESLSGFRIGVAVAPPAIATDVEQVLAMTSLRAPAYSQQLLRRWLLDDEEFLATRVTDLRALRDRTYEVLTSVPGVTAVLPQGTAYLFPDVSALGSDDYTIAARFRSEAGVIVSPGYQFGPRGVGHFRVCFARDEAEWDLALHRMVEVLRTAS